MPKRKVKIGIELANACTWVNHLALHPENDDLKNIMTGSPELFTTSNATYIAKHLLAQGDCNVYIYDEYVNEDDYDAVMEDYVKKFGNESA